jgi:hypothetical protein
MVTNIVIGIAAGLVLMWLAVIAVGVAVVRGKNRADMAELRW